MNKYCLTKYGFIGSRRDCEQKNKYNKSDI